MGKILIIKGADFSAVAVGKVTPIGPGQDVTINALTDGEVRSNGSILSTTGIFHEEIGVRYALIPIDEYAGNSITIVGNHNGVADVDSPIGSIIGFLTDNVLTNSKMAPLCSTVDKSMHRINKGDTYESIIPLNCRYLYVYLKTQNNDMMPDSINVHI